MNKKTGDKMEKQYHWIGRVPLLFAINKDWILPKKVAENLALELHYIDKVKFSDGEFKCKFNEHVRRSEIYLIAENTPAEKFFELLVAIDALTRAGVGEINLVIPYPGWLRQDRIKEPHESLTAKLVYGILDRVPRVARFIIMDPHTEKANLSVEKPWDILFSAKYFIDKIKSMNIELSDVTVVASDFGIQHTAKYIANKLNTDLAVILKDRKSDSKVEVTGIMTENPLKKNIFLIDDIISTFGTGEEDVKYIVNNHENIEKIFFAAPHAVLAGDAIERIKRSKVDRMFVADTVYIDPGKHNEKIEIIPVSDIFSNGIYQIHNEGGSVSKLSPKELRK